MEVGGSNPGSIMDYTDNNHKSIIGRKDLLLKKGITVTLKQDQMGNSHLYIYFLRA